MMNINPNVSSIMAKTGSTAGGTSKASQAGQTKEFNNTLKALKNYDIDGNC